MSVPAAYLGVILIWSTTPLGIQWSAQGASFDAGRIALIGTGLFLYEWQALRQLHNRPGKCGA